MDLILEKKLKRQLIIIQAMLKNYTTISLQEVAELTNVSIKTSEKDLQEISLTLQEDYELKQTRHHTYYLTDASSNDWTTIYYLYLKKSVVYYFLTASMRGRSNIRKGSRDIFISESHLYKKVMLFNNIMPEDIKLSTSALRLSGNEISIRYLLWKIIRDDPDLEAWGITNAIYQEAVHTINMIQKVTHIELCPSAQNKMIIWAAICKIRRKEHPVTSQEMRRYVLKKDINIEKMSILYDKFASKTDNTNEIMLVLNGLRLTPSSYMQLTQSWFIESSKVVKWVNYLFKKLKIENSVESKKLKILVTDLVTFSNHFVHMYELKNETVQIHSLLGQIIYSYIASQIKQVVSADKNRSVYNDRFQKFLTDLIYIHGWSILRNQVMQPVYISVYNSYSKELRKIIEKKINTYFEGYIEIKNKEREIIISDCPLSDDKATDVIIWKNVPDDNDWKRLEKKVSQIFYQKNSFLQNSI
ncbi:helix-turn-helix domain-containing protein [Listeria ilorinensis]|uniref:helix-turn-helix domain-containing protein n=1 Tax=Listeria ilorinensis TaxID=2867439 RepID=UPI001EF56459|nr:helix-turn-helix domain-containing protein [Listeria ilorinensis]